MNYLYQFLAHLSLPFASLLFQSPRTWKSKLLHAASIYFLCTFFLDLYTTLIFFVIVPILGILSWSITWFKKQRTTTARLAFEHTAILSILIMLNHFIIFHDSEIHAHQEFAHNTNVIDPLIYKFTELHRGDVVLVDGDDGFHVGQIIGQPGDSVWINEHSAQTTNIAKNLDQKDNDPVSYSYPKIWSDPKYSYFKHGKIQLGFFGVAPAHYYIVFPSATGLKWGPYTKDQIRGRIIWGISTGSRI